MNKLPRKEFIEKSILATSVFWALGFLSGSSDDNHSSEKNQNFTSPDSETDFPSKVPSSQEFKWMTPEALRFFVASTPAILAGTSFEQSYGKNFSPKSPFLKNLDQAFFGLSRENQKDLKLVMKLVDYRVVRFLVLGLWKPFENASSREIEESLTHWSAHAAQDLQKAFDAVRKLVLATWYADPLSQVDTGYPGPPTI